MADGWLLERSGEGLLRKNHLAQKEVRWVGGGTGLLCYFVCYFRLTKQGCRKRFFLGNRGIMKQEDTPKRSFESAASTNSATLAIYRSRSEKRRKHNEISEISKPNIRRVYGHREISGGQQFPWVGVNLGWVSIHMLGERWSGLGVRPIARKLQLPPSSAHKILNPSLLCENCLTRLVLITSRTQITHVQGQECSPSENWSYK